MSSATTKIPSRSLLRLLISSPGKLFSRSLSAATETRTQKLERIAVELLDLTRLELNDYNILLRHKLGLNRYGPAVSGPTFSGSSAEGSEAAQAEAKAAEKTALKAAEKTAFDVRLEKFEAAAKLKIIKEVRAFTDLGLKEAKDLVEKTPCVVKKGVSKEEGEGILQKLKELGATVVLE